MTYPVDKYARRIVINFMDHGFSYTRMAHAWTEKGYLSKNFRSIQIKNIYEMASKKAEIQAAFSGLKQTDKVLIYLSGHGDIGEDKLSSEGRFDDPKITFPVDLIARLLVESFPMNIFKLTPGQEPKLKISLGSCYAGCPENNPVNYYLSNHINNSFAACLLYQLTQMKIHCNISARMGSIWIMYTDYARYIVSAENNKNYSDYIRKANELEKKYSPLIKNPDVDEQVLRTYREEREEIERNLSISRFAPKDICSKVVYSYDQIKKEQVILPAYAISNDEDRQRFAKLHQDLLASTHATINGKPFYSWWKIKVLDTIRQCFYKAQAGEKKEKLKQLGISIKENKDDIEIYQLLRQVLAEKPNEGYHINTHNNWYEFGQTNTAKELQQVLSRRP